MKKEVKLSQVVQSKPHIIIRKEKNCYLLIDREKRAVLVVNDLGMDIWNQISRKTAVKDLIGKVMKKHNVQFEPAKREAIKFLTELLNNEFLCLNDDETCSSHPQSETYHGS